jgi:hypothetical protein
VNTYDIFVTPKNSVSEQRFVMLARDFADRLQGKNLIVSYQLLKVSNLGNFDGMPNYKLISYFENESHKNTSMNLIKESFLNEPAHKELMASVSEFKVTFSEVI